MLLCSLLTKQLLPLFEDLPILCYQKMIETLDLDHLMSTSNTDGFDGRQFRNS